MSFKLTIFALIVARGGKANVYTAKISKAPGHTNPPLSNKIFWFDQIKLWLILSR